MNKIFKHEYFEFGSKFKISSFWLNHRLQQCISDDKELQRAIKEDRVSFGTLDTWLLSRLKMDKIKDQVTDITSASSTGLYDPYYLNYSAVMLKIFNIKKTILPKVVSNSHNFGFTHENIFGVPVKIATVITDQSASMIGNCCFNKWSSKITLGTGSFLHVRNFYFF
jgi:putative glycerol kinase 5